MQSKGLDTDQLVVADTKNFGESNGQIYAKRWLKDYFLQRTNMVEGYLEQNEQMKLYCGICYLDLIGLVIDENGTMPVFTPIRHFESQDCRHLSKGCTIWYGGINWDK